MEVAVTFAPPDHRHCRRARFIWSMVMLETDVGDLDRFVSDARPVADQEHDRPAQTLGRPFPPRVADLFAGVVPPLVHSPLPPVTRSSPPACPGAELADLTDVSRRWPRATRCTPLARCHSLTRFSCAATTVRQQTQLVQSHVRASCSLPHGLYPAMTLVSPAALEDWSRAARPRRSRCLSGLRSP